MYSFYILNQQIGYKLFHDAVDLEELGVINTSRIIEEYKELKKNNCFLAMKLLKLLVLDFIYWYDIEDYREKQKITTVLSINLKPKISQKIKSLM